jgi:CBS domain-containing protein
MGNGSDALIPQATWGSAPPRGHVAQFARENTAGILNRAADRRTTKLASAARISLDALCDPIPSLLNILALQIESAPDVDCLARIGKRARDSGKYLLRHDLGASAMTRYLTSINDLLSRRIIELALSRCGQPPTQWCWMIMGSQARCEQTFCTDQDNGIIFAAPDRQDTDRLRRWFQPFAESINADLAACGMSLCKGGIMAGNAACCLSLDEWRDRFSTWMRIPDPDALLNATIYFDFRIIHGDAELGDDLRDAVLRMAPTSSTFLYLMSLNALQVDVPIGFIREFVTDHGRGTQRSLDMKKSGVRLFVGAARILALAAGCRETGTVDRLRAAGPAAGFSPADIDAVVQAFNQMQGFRMHSQTLDASDDAGEDRNRLMPADLNSLDRKILRACFEQARLIQLRLRTRFAREQ